MQGGCWCSDIDWSSMHKPAKAYGSQSMCMCRWLFWPCRNTMIIGLCIQSGSLLKPVKASRGVCAGGCWGCAGSRRGIPCRHLLEPSFACSSTLIRYSDTVPWYSHLMRSLMRSLIRYPGSRCGISYRHLLEPSFAFSGTLIRCFDTVS